MEYREVTISSSADSTFAALVALLEIERFQLQDVDRSNRVIRAESANSRGWIFSLLVILTLGLVGQPKSVTVTARVDEAGADALLSIEMRQLYGWPAPYDYSGDIERLLRELVRRLGPSNNTG